ncbi:hypothetical protein AKJ64_04935 [candidate division MSBL1 archaeon SCGC-AAA259E17]|uniref:Diaminopimelate epimerase n=1 Tax=candidate division MSBL1 archaeon SCGC-AAA259E17 TaxID=1698263 RepID=A0A133UAA8_9EURY|nr:hypothetical protein AKJ64_04935 [candidate division MSBL1 archaeon SCGC-AAA259E17]
MKITKMHGIGNSQILVEDLGEELEARTGLSYNKIAQALCDPNFGIGSDQTLVITPSVTADFKMRVFNKDGGEAEMCGNGIRCVAKYLYDRDMISENLSIETKAGIKELWITSENGKTDVEVDMGKGELLEEDKRVNKFVGQLVSVGNPHFVIFTEDASKDLARREGPGLETAEEFQPERANIEFVKTNSSDELETYVWERGSGLTLACGTGACAVAFAAKKKGLVAREVIVKLLGGELKISIEDDNHITMEGPAEYIFEGEVSNVRKIYSNIQKS